MPTRVWQRVPIACAVRIPAPLRSVLVGIVTATAKLRARNILIQSIS